MKNSSSLLSFKTEQDLANDFYAIGTNFSADERRMDADIEETLISASIEGINKDDHRVRGILVDWISIHHLRINVDRLTRMVKSLTDDEFVYVRIFWCANAQRLQGSDPRFKRLAQIYKGPRVDFVDRNLRPGQRATTDMFIQMKGLDERFEGTCIRVPKNAFFHRPHQIFEAEEIAKYHMAFRYRVMFGASYRADIWALLRRNPALSAYRLSKLAGCSTTTALRVKNDYEIVKRDYSQRAT